MGIGVIVTRKSFQGEEWENTYPFSVGGAGGLTNENLATIGMDRDFTDSGTTVGDLNYGDGALGGIPLAYAILGWERAMHAQAVQFTNIYVTDKLENSAITDLGANTFAVKPLAFTGRKTISQVAPGNNTLMINRVPAQFSRRGGRLYLRGALSVNDIAFLGKGLLDWASPEARNTLRTYNATQLAASGLNAFFQGGLGVGEIGIGRYRKGIQIPPLDEGDIYEVVQVENFIVQRPVSRQVRKGKKKTA